MYLVEVEGYGDGLGYGDGRGYGNGDGYGNGYGYSHGYSHVNGNGNGLGRGYGSLNEGSFTVDHILVLIAVQNLRDLTKGKR